MKTTNFYDLKIKDFLSIKNKHKFFEEHGLVFEIPEFQRDYSWGLNQLEEFFDDILEAKSKYEKYPDHPCLGIVYLYFNAESKSFEVIDGQQRLTSIILLTEAFKKSLLLDDIKHSIFNISANKRIINGYSKDCVLEKKYVKFFDKFLNDEIDDIEEIKADDTCKKLLNSYNFFANKINENFKTKIEKLDFYNFILENVFFIFYVEKENEIKYNLFTKLNSRGSELQFTTLLKSHLYSVDTFKFRDIETNEEITRHFATKYENIETKWFTQMSKLNKEQKYNKIKDMCGFFAQNYSTYFFSKAKKPFANESNNKKLFAKYRELISHLFSEYINELQNPNINKNDFQIKKFFEKMDIYNKRYIRFCVENDYDEIISSLQKIDIKKYLSLIIYMEIEYPDLALKFKEHVFVYCYLRRMKNIVENSRLPEGTKKEQINPRNLHFEEILQIIVSRGDDNCNKAIEVLRDKIQTENFSVFNKEYLKIKDNLPENNNLNKDIKNLQEVTELYIKLLEKYGFQIN